MTAVKRQRKLLEAKKMGKTKNVIVYVPLHFEGNIILMDIASFSKTNIGGIGNSRKNTKMYQTNGKITYNLPV